MPYQDTSFAAYDSIQVTLGEKQKLVLWAFKANGDMTNEELSKYIDWPINCCTPRTGELVKKGLLEAKGVKVGVTRRMAILWGIKT